MNSNTILESILRQELELCRDLLRTLEDEYSAIDSNSLHNIEQVVTRKQKLLIKIEEAESRRKEHIKNSTQLMHAAGGENHLSEKNDKLIMERHSQKLLNELSEIMSECRRLNRVIGSIIQHRSLIVKQALELLTGRALNNSLYTSTGMSGSSSEGQLLGRA